MPYADLLLRVAIAAAVALIFYFVATALVAFNHSTLIFGLIGLAIFLFLAFGTGDRIHTRRRS